MGSPQRGQVRRTRTSPWDPKLDPLSRAAKGAGWWDRDRPGETAERKRGRRAPESLRHRLPSQPSAGCHQPWSPHRHSGPRQGLVGGSPRRPGSLRSDRRASWSARSGQRRGTGRLGRKHGRGRVRLFPPRAPGAANLARLPAAAAARADCSWTGRRAETGAAARGGAGRGGAVARATARPHKGGGANRGVASEGRGGAGAGSRPPTHALSRAPGP